MNWGIKNNESKFEEREVAGRKQAVLKEPQAPPSYDLVKTMSLSEFLKAMKYGSEKLAKVIKQMPFCPSLGIAVIGCNCSDVAFQSRKNCVVRSRSHILVQENDLNVWSKYGLPDSVEAQLIDCLSDRVTIPSFWKC